MKDNTYILLVGEIILGLMGIVAMLRNEMSLASTAAGAFIGLLAGHLNGTHNDTEKKKGDEEE